MKKDLKKAIELYQKAASQENAFAQTHLGICYKNGIGVEKNIQKAIELFQKTAEQGNAYGQYNLGYCYEYGVGVEQNEHKAIELYQKAAEQRYIKAQNKIYVLLYDDRSKLKRKVQELNKVYPSKKRKQNN